LSREARAAALPEEFMPVESCSGQLSVQAYPFTSVINSAALN